MKKSTVENTHFLEVFWAFCTKNQSVIYSSSLQFCKSKKREEEEEKLIGAIDCHSGSDCVKIIVTRILCTQ